MSGKKRPLPNSGASSVFKRYKFLVPESQNFQVVSDDVGNKIIDKEKKTDTKKVTLDDKLTLIEEKTIDNHSRFTEEIPTRLYHVTTPSNVNHMPSLRCRYEPAAYPSTLTRFSEDNHGNIPIMIQECEEYKGHMYVLGVIQDNKEGERGPSISIKVQNFKPWFYVLRPTGVHISALQRTLNDLLTKNNTHSWGNNNKNESKDKIKLVEDERLELIEFHFEENTPVYKVVFQSIWDYRIVKKILLNEEIKCGTQRFKCKLFNHDCPLRIMLFSSSKTSMYNTFFIRKEHLHSQEKADGKRPNCVRLTTQLQCYAQEEHIFPQPDYVKIGSLLIASFDIETVAGKSYTGYPNFNRMEDMINMITVNFYWQGEKIPIKSVILCLGACTLPNNLQTKEEYPNGVELFQFNKEGDLLRAFHLLITIKNDVDVLVSYNGIGYDIPWILNRAKTLGLLDICKLSKFLDPKNISNNKNNFEVKAEIEEKTSNQVGERVEYRIHLPGRTNFDVLRVVLREKKTMSSYKLQDTAPELIKTKNPVEKARFLKIDLPYRMLRPYFMDGPEKRGIVAEYCLRDAELPYRIAEDQKFFTNYYQMANLTQTCNEHLIVAGETVKVMNVIWLTVQNEGWILNRDDLKRFSEKNVVPYIGATVISPSVGFYPHPIAGFDYNSLYPSIMIAWNLCYSTILVDPIKIQLAIQKGYTVIEQKLKESNNPWFVLNAKSLLPPILKKFLSARKEAKNLYMKYEAEKNYPVSAVYNGKQGALKICANSIYGFTGADGNSKKAQKRANTLQRGRRRAPLSINDPAYGLIAADEKKTTAGPLPLVAIASSVTRQGREMLRMTREYFENRGDRVVYGDTDSCFVEMKNSLARKWNPMVRIDYKTNEKGDSEPENVDISSKEDKDALLTLMKECSDCAKEISKMFRAPNKLNFEKITTSFILLAKKKYGALTMEYNEEKHKAEVKRQPDVKGLASVRRDWCPLSRKLSSKVLDMQLQQKQESEILECIEKTVDDMAHDRVPLQEYKMTKKLKGRYPVSDPIHKVVANKIAARDPTLAPLPGDRVDYAAIENGEVQYAKQGEAFEYVVEHKLPLKLDYYYEKQIVKPIMTTLIHSIPDIKKKLHTIGLPVRKKMLRRKSVFSSLTFTQDKMEQDNIENVIEDVIEQDKIVNAPVVNEEQENNTNEKEDEEFLTLPTQPIPLSTRSDIILSKSSNKRPASTTTNFKETLFKRIKKIVH
jgi:DNA polymerase delta subunit 1